MTIRYYSSTKVLTWNEILEALKEDASHFIVVFKEYKTIGIDSTVQEFITSDLYKLERIIYDVHEQGKSWVEFTDNEGHSLTLPMYEIINVKGIKLH